MYSLGKDFYPSEHEVGLICISHDTKVNIGNKNAFEIYNGMPAYSVLTIPAGVYRITGKGYFNGNSDY
jgi:hypothetical protein